MKLSGIAAAGFLAFFSCVLATEGQAEGYVLVWADEFNTDGRPDPNNWTYEYGFVRNEELQWYQPDNAFCEGGRLIIEGRRERVKNPRYEPGSRDWKRNREFAEYTSACVLTRGLHAWKFGRFEIRAKIEATEGLWPAIWTLGSARGWPGCGEIDIMEYYRGMILANACWESGVQWKPTWDDSKTPVEEFGGPEWDDEFHLWRMDWDEKEIAIYLDGRLLNTIDLTQTINKDNEGANPFHEPHYLLLNLAIGGRQGGDPSKVKFPTRYEIDYVRVYQKRSQPKNAG